MPKNWYLCATNSGETFAVQSFDRPDKADQITTSGLFGQNGLQTLKPSDFKVIGKTHSSKQKQLFMALPKWVIKIVLLFI